MLNICVVYKSDFDALFLKNAFEDRLKRNSYGFILKDITNSIRSLFINGTANVIFVRDIDHVINLPDGYRFDYYYSTFTEIEGTEYSCTLEHLRNVYGNGAELMTLEEVYKVIYDEIDKEKKAQLIRRINSMYGLASYDPYISKRGLYEIARHVNKEMEDYCRHDVLTIQEATKTLKEMEEKIMGNPEVYGAEMIIRQKGYLEIEKVIFNYPATIVFWKDGTKTVVKAKGEAFDKEKGLAMAITKKALGNKGNYFNTIKKWVGENGNDNISINANTADDVIQLTKDIFGYDF